MTVGARLSWSMNVAGIDTAAELARQLPALKGRKISEQSITAYLRNFRHPPLDVAEHIGRTLRVRGVWLRDGTGPSERSMAELMDRPVVGYVGAGGEAVFEPMGDGSSTIALYKPSPQSVAVRIVGDSLGHGFNGWYAVYEDVQRPVTDSLLNRLCIMEVEDGRKLIKWLRRGSLPGLYNLISGVGSVEENAEVRWAALVETMVPP